MTKNTKYKIVACLIGLSLMFGAIHIFAYQSPQLDRDLSDLEQIIKSDLQNNGKYKRRELKTINGVGYEVHEYKTPEGEVGYVIYMTREDDNGIYKKVVNSGVETYREKDWFMILDKTPYTNTTSTK